MIALILADGDGPTRAGLDRGWPGWADDVGLVIAADGGARQAAALAVTIDLWVGDGDSIDEAGLAALDRAGVAIERSPIDKDATDTELAIEAALRRAADGVILVGALGGPRIDHALANVGLLALPGLARRSAVIYTSRSRITLLDPDRGTVRLTGAPGDLVSLLPIGGPVVAVTTSGLRFPLAAETLPPGSSRGVSNVVVTVGATVSARSGRLLIVESPATLAS